MTQPQISLLPLSAEWHSAALQRVYAATPGYWAMYNYPGAPAGQAEHDLRTAGETPGRTIMGILQTTDHSAESQWQEDRHPDQTPTLIGVLDFRLHWPNPQQVYIGMMLVAEPYQRRRVGTQAWSLVAPWLAQTARMEKARLAVEQFNPHALRFFESLGFTLTGEANRIKVGEKLVRLLSMELPLTTSTATTDLHT